MKDVAQYLIKYGFGLKAPDPWSESHPHLGVDRPTPLRTPLFVNGQLIGYTGNTGGVAAHHHLQKLVSGRAVDPGNGGFIIPTPATVFDAGDPKGGEQQGIGKHIRIRDAQGVEWSHFHLDEIKVAIGDTIGDNMEQKLNDGDITNISNDTGLSKDALKAQPNWNKAYYQVVAPWARKLRPEAPFNNGDVKNLAAKLGVPESELVGKNWNKVYYEVVMPKLDDLLRQLKVYETSFDKKTVEAMKALSTLKDFLKG